MGDADQGRERITDPEASDVERARQLYRERGVVVGEFRDVVEGESGLRDEWADVGQPLDGDEAAPGPGSRADTEGSY